MWRPTNPKSTLFGRRVSMQGTSGKAIPISDGPNVPEGGSRARRLQPEGREASCMGSAATTISPLPDRCIGLPNVLLRVPGAGPL